MKGKIKAVGLLVVATLAMSVVVAPAASAEALFTQPQNDYPVAITGHEESEAVNAFTLQGGETECDSVTFEATLEEASTSLTVTPHYTECQFSGVKSTVHLNGCDYELTAEQETSAEDVHGSMHIRCPQGQSITTTIPESGSLCVVHVPEQTAAGEVTFTNNVSSEPQDVTADIEVELMALLTKESIFCPLEAGEATKVYETEITFTGYEDLGTHSNPGTPGTETLTEGSQSDIDVGAE